MTRSYSLTIIPIREDGKVFYRGSEFTLSAKVHNINIHGVKYYIRQNGKEYEKLVAAVIKSLESMFNGFEIKQPVKITLELEDYELIEEGIK